MTFKVTIFAANAVQSLQGPADKQGDLRIVAGQTLHKEQLAYTDSDGVVIVSAPISFSFDADVVKHNAETGSYNIVDVDGKKITFTPGRGLSITIQDLAEAEAEEEPAPKAKKKKAAEVDEEEVDEEVDEEDDDLPTTKRGAAAKKAAPAKKKKVVEEEEEEADEEEDAPPPKKKKAAPVEEEEDDEPAPKAKKKKSVETNDEDFNWED